MQSMKWWLGGFALSMSLVAPGLTLAAGPGYNELKPPRPANSGKKVEVIEFFGYGCPHCFTFDPALQNWVKKQGDNISFKRVPVMFHKPWAFHQKLFYTMEALGKSEEWHDKVFQAINIERQPLSSEEAIVAFAAKQGVDKKKFLDSWNGFSVDPKIKRANQMQEEYQANESPYVVIDGRYAVSITSAAQMVGEDKPEAQLQQTMLKVMDDLVVKSRKK